MSYIIDISVSGGSDAAGIIQVDYEPTNTNLADICTKTQAGPKRRELCAKILY
jgi:hypothetical protein